MNTTTRTPTRSAGSSGNGAQILREAAETGSAQAKQTFEQMAAATADATNLISNSYATAARRAQDYNTKFLEFAQTNAQTAFKFFQQLTAVKTPTEFFELSTDHSRKQLEILTDQARVLATLGQKVLSTTAERIEKDVTKAHAQRGN